jgi:hypothetical protein
MYKGSILEGKLFPDQLLVPWPSMQPGTDQGLREPRVNKWTSKWAHNWIGQRREKALWEKLVEWAMVMNLLSSNSCLKTHPCFKEVAALYEKQGQEMNLEDLRFVFNTVAFELLSFHEIVVGHLVQCLAHEQYIFLSFIHLFIHPSIHQSINPSIHPSLIHLLTTTYQTWCQKLVVEKSSPSRWCSYRHVLPEGALNWVDIIAVQVGIIIISLPWVIRKLSLRLHELPPVPSPQQYMRSLSGTQHQGVPVGTSQLSAANAFFSSS